MADDAVTTTVRCATPADDAALLSLWAAAFDAPLMVPLWELVPDRHDRTLVAVDPDGSVVAAAVSVPRRVRSATGAVETVAGVANVATHPDARGRGLARTVLAELVARAAADGADWALLFTGTPGVYSGSGWTGFTQRHRRGRLRDTPAAPPRAARLSPLLVTEHASTPETWDALAPLHDAAVADRPLATFRSPADRRRTALWHSGATLLVATEPGSTDPVGYVVVETDGPVARVVELAPDHVTAARPLLRAAAGAARAAGCTELVLRLPDSPALAALADELLDHVCWDEDRTGMTYPLRSSPAAVRDTVEHPRAHHGTGDYL